MQISQNKEKCSRNGYFNLEIKNFHKSKIGSLKKLSTRAPPFYDFLHFKGWSYLNCKISFNLCVQIAIFLVFHSPFMILFHILSPVLDHELMLDDFLITSSVIHLYVFTENQFYNRNTKHKIEWTACTEQVLAVLFCS